MFDFSLHSCRTNASASRRRSGAPGLTPAHLAPPILGPLDDAEIASIAADERFDDLDGPIVRITTPHVPLPAADVLEDTAMPSTQRIVQTVPPLYALNWGASPKSVLLIAGVWSAQARRQ